MPPSYFPLRWESTGDQWWYASPIDWAAANGLYDVVRELLNLDSNLLIKLTSLRRIRRLETVWDDEAQFADVAECRSRVAKKLLLEAELNNGQNTLIRAGYGGWLLYTAASAGDLGFVTDLLQRDALLVFGEGEFGVTDILYAAARGKNSEVFKLLLHYAISPTCYFSSGSETEKQLPERETRSTFGWEVMNRAVHASARGGNVEILKNLLADEPDILVYRDAHGSTILHSAAGRGQVEVVKDVVESFDIIFSTDNLGNTALHVAAYRGYLSVVELLSQASPSLKASTNNVGDTFLHMAVAGFRAPGFRRLDKQIELVKQLISGKLLDMEEIINVRNNKGRTALHMAVSENFNSYLIELLISVGRINLNIRDADGMTPLDLLKQRPRTASSEVLIKQMISAGGIANQLYHAARRALVSQLKMHGGGSSPGRRFGVSDGEILLYTSVDGIGDEVDDSETSGCEISDIDSPNLAEKKKRASRLKFLLDRARKNGLNSAESRGDDLEMAQSSGGASLRQRYSKSLSLVNSKSIFSFSHSSPSPSLSQSTKEKFTAGLMQGVVQTMPSLAIAAPSTSSPKGAKLGRDKGSGTEAGQGSANSKMINEYLSLGAQGVAVDESIRCKRLDQNDQQFSSLVA